MGHTWRSARAALAGASVAVMLFALGAPAGGSLPPTTASTPAYGDPGPDVVGVATIDLGIAAPKFGERYATVFYPSALSLAQAASLPRFSYAQADTLPAAYQAILPAKYDLTTTVDAYENVPGSSGGPYPVVLFDFGASGQRLLYSNLLSGIASWGHVVVAADYFEHSLAAQVMSAGGKSSTGPTTAAQQKKAAALDLSVMLSSLHAVEGASAAPSSVLHGTVDAARVAAIGHSAGGQTAFDALNSPQVMTAIGWSPVGPVGTPARKPVMMIRPQGDDVITAVRVDREYAAFRGPTALVEPSRGGHNTYTDTCVVIRNGGGLIKYAIVAHFVSAKLARLGFNGCLATDVAPQSFWRAVQYYTVFQLEGSPRPPRSDDGPGAGQGGVPRF